MMDRETQKPRGYGFVTYDNEATVERLLSRDVLVMDGKEVSVDFPEEKKW
jgi:RNA-binding protein Musashi